MSAAIVQSPSPVTLLGAGRIGRAALAASLKLAPVVVAADGGANMAVRAGIVPEAVIGDLDSVGRLARAAIPAARFHRIAEQETTDFEKCLTRIEAPFLLGLGFSGPRTDHTLAVWNALVRHPARACLILAGREVVFAAPRRMTLDVPPGTRVSLFPMARVSGRSRGLAWPIAGLDFAPDRRIGTSNRAEGAVELSFDAPGMLTILPAAVLPAAIAALRASEAW
ncbi:MAG: thiamine diphosphokinase [Rhodobacteraceae bacterium]|nr:thiamine diphosphokinase [Paracoccaceae bacterium]